MQQIPALLLLLIRAFRSLLKNWNASPAPIALQQIGNAWGQANASAVLEVPTPIMPLKSNYLLHSAHPDYSQITFGKPQRFVFNERLRKN